MCQKSKWIPVAIQAIMLGLRHLYTRGGPQTSRSAVRPRQGSANTARLEQQSGIWIRFRMLNQLNKYSHPLHPLSLFLFCLYLIIIVIFIVLFVFFFIAILFIIFNVCIIISSIGIIIIINGKNKLWQHHYCYHHQWRHDHRRDRRHHNHCKNNIMNYPLIFSPKSICIVTCNYT